MRRRVLIPLLVLGLVAVCAILVPTCSAIADARTQQLQLQRTGAVEQVVQRARAVLGGSGSPATLQRYLERFHSTYGEAVLVVDGSGERLAEAGGIPGNAATERAATAALRGLPQWTLPTVLPWSPDSALVAQPIATASSAAEGAVVLRVDQASAKRDVLSGWILVGVVGAALLVALLLASNLWTRWVIRPVLALDAATRAVSEHRGFDAAAVTGPPELRRLAASFERMAGEVEDALAQQRGLVADASHQLRNPLAAIRLRVDGLPRDDPESRSEAEAVENDLDRLERTVDRMLVLAEAEHRANSEPSRSPVRVRCTVSAASLVDPYRAALAGSGIDVLASSAEAELPFRRGDLEEIVEILVDNARKYAGSGARIRVEVRGSPAELVVADSGSGLAEAELARVGTRFWRSEIHRALPGTGLGYAIVEQLARSNGAGVEVSRAPEGGLLTRVRMGDA
ncbi:hypothetical protein BMH32_03895 [Leucobacter sp. OLJS4]|uniref:sensor histidine kinase n=1 Tax=unclassified Leucobacter TaxID=2621730 RepID=UPI000C193735|nr:MULTISPECIES: HAMP domain-containing sensor histidine kinase [unclassified Leucobacter]PII82831.1 hypothetical protein BMH25_08820 [Leucobacter sp. OLCALW19]PII88061.1 hypothetical protein BMH26_07280 [Leucobacter sp. OLTLW20]PII91919.1 hypothetical protein BMH27_07365 [Leucobacter sp. OLAS13]PIJ00241.1 hypothetical protein BMH29_02650 [Leucobacter sp. OLDS2]PIJ02834.1 hypothetical protein BMH28_04195 [Leucobacter sp. OLCS4]